ncbi:ribose 5-phosphate isomerase B [Desulfonatronovibrio hydrogenovorans]|uniref:ribose 5-phosphate isomerase B n=1 Tax=Desulfonatronovibrio hydrogenovorans TaxID=53245 RepID=UPI00048B709D|nr:ribose 5-phosphate isomerase B [Desulfonatronovibrio hydrogenovorans]
MKKKIVFGSDHAGMNLKETLMDHLGHGYDIMDVGPSEKTSCDYPVYAKKLCTKVLELGCPGILICGSGIGMSIAANRIPGIRAALCSNEYMARMSRMHNNANVLCLGERIIGVDLARSIMDAFLCSSFEGGRHLQRIELMENMVQSC